MRPQQPMICEMCRKEFMAFVNQVKVGRGKTCSYACSARKTNLVRKSMAGENNGNWKGGVSFDLNSSRGRYITKYPERYEAHKQTLLAKRLGILKPSACEKCCYSGKTEAHHTDYSRPLQVHWLCRKCHLDEHVTLRKLKQ